MSAKARTYRMPAPACDIRQLRFQQFVKSNSQFEGELVIMLRRYTAVVLLAFCIFSPAALLAQQPATTTPQAASTPVEDPIAKIKDEGMNRSQVMQTLSYLTDVIGPRLTSSPGMKRANDWTRDQLTKWGLQNAHLESWGPFGRGWSLRRFSAEVVSPTGIPLIAYPKAW